MSNNSSLGKQVQFQAMAMISIHRIVSRIHSEMFEGTYASSHEQQQAAEKPESYGGPLLALIRGLAGALGDWRSLLPAELQWVDEHRFNFPGIDDDGRCSRDVLFTTTPNEANRDLSFSLDLFTAQLRSRYYYALFMIYRPFVYKALHYPDQMSEEDKINANKKRLIPYLFTWTQNFMAILVILRASYNNEMLYNICQSYVNRQEMQETVVMLQEWFEDMSQVDGMAR
ncbi:hypothetical protein LTS18_006742 [Coniosporium uncinatum]|uniref:Uncharacterized protein n=1 Tax=Coniosporium uncinatum TaxID=93489 RepID=A0ACC3DCE6_9PEZI|nr:hypothetical protein LTS18_006742 [Coniosporium uncinatum]